MRHLPTVAVGNGGRRRADEVGIDPELWVPSRRFRPDVRGIPGIVWIVGILLAAAGAAFVIDRATGSNGSNDETWYRYHPDGETFSVTLPAGDVRPGTEQGNRSGHAVTITIAEDGLDDESKVSLSWWHVPGEVDRSDAERDAFGRFLSSLRPGP